MRIWIGRTILVGAWILATHGALDMVQRISAPSGVLGAVAFALVSLGMIWLAVHLGDAPFWNRRGDPKRQES